MERVRGEPPTDPSWRADALAGSRHSRLLDELRLPVGDADPERAAALCAEVARLALGDLAPALILLPPDLRRRAQTLAAYTLTLFDFAAQSGLEGERLSQINRWEFELEAALDGEPATQPVFVSLQREEARRPWDREALDRVVAAGRRRVLRPRPRTAAELAAESEAVGAALLTALAGPRAGAEGGRLGGVLLRVAALRDLGEAARRGRAGLPLEELRPAEAGEPLPPGRVGEAVAAESERLRRLLDGGFDLATLPAGLGPAARYSVRAADALLRRIAALGAEVTRRPPVLGLAPRLLLLVRARAGL